MRRRPLSPRDNRPGRLLAPLLSLATALALAAGAGAQGGAGAGMPIAPAPVDTGLARPAPAPAPAAPDSLRARAAGTDSARFDSLATDSAGGGWRVVVPREDSLRAAAIPLDRSAWISWTPRVSKLALPMNLLRNGLFTPDEPFQLRYPIDARAVRVAVDPIKGTITQSLSAADIDLARAQEIPLEDYAKDLTARNLRREWVEQSARRIDNIPATLEREQTRGPLTFQLPVVLPKAARSILGDGGPSLNVSGSERISIAGTSNWDNLTSGTGVKRSLFPSLDMKQDLDIRLDGSLGDKVRVDVAQNSATTVPLANRIGIRYTGYDDEIIKNLDLGNTNLSLPGTQYVSYSGRNEGLFGVKAAARVGGTDLALIASKQEGRSERRSFQGSAQEVTRTIDDVNYVKGKYFFLQRPAEQLATDSRIEISTVRAYIDDRNGSNDQGVRGGYAEIDPTQPPGGSPRIAGSFDGLRVLQDFEISVFYYGDRFPILMLKNAMSNSQILAVTYDEVLADGTRRAVGSVPDLPADPLVPADSVRVKLLQAPRDLLKAQPENTDFFETDPAIDPFIITRDYELKNFYDLQTANIDPKSLLLQVRRYDAASEEATDAYKEGGQLFSYLQIMGVDLFKDNGTGTALEGPDQLVDQFTNAYYLDTERGILFFPDLRPFDPRVGPRPDATPEEEFFFRPRLEVDRSIPGLRGRIFWPPGMANPPGIGGGITPEELEANRNPYDKRNIQLVQDRRYYVWAKFAGQDYSGTIILGQVGILEGSEVVAIEGVPLERNKDYSIDYDAGTVTLLTQRAQQNRSRLSIDYSYAPLFAQAGKTLVGGTFGFRDPKRALGGAFIYEAKGQQESRPRLGEEPSRTLIGDVYGDFKLKPQFLTDLADRLPFYSTTEPSQFDINGEVGLSLPNPNTKNTVYLDDFEGNRDSYSAPMSRGFWKWPAPPLTINGAAVDTVQADYAELIWYNPVNTVEARDLNPRLTRAEGAENLVTVLDFYVPRAPAVRPNPAALWTGVTTTVEPDGADFSRLQYLEVWVNDWRDPDVRMDPDLKLHVDLGVISEDQQRAPGVGPNGVFDTEDRNRDGKYDQGSDPATREDPGADAVPDELEAELYDLSTAGDADKHGDNFRPSDVNLGDDGNRAARLDPQNYVSPTLSEKSKGTYEVGSRLFTEDLNSNQSLDASNDYVTFTLPLGDDAALAPFLIFAAESTLTIEGNPVAPNNGWRRYRIPLDVSDAAVRRVINGGSLSNVKHMRVWLEGFDTFQGIAAPPKLNESERGRQPLIQLAAVDVVGNRWRITSADSATRLANGSVVARNVNNQEDRNIYDPPFGVETQNTGGSTETQREQSIALEVSRLPVGSTATIFKDQTLAEDYTRYSRLAFYQTAFGFSDEDSARFFIRMGYDDRNYYEYSRPIRGAASAPFRPTPWQEHVLTLTDFTDVKLNRPVDAIADTVVRGEEQFVVVGAPTFTRIQRLTLGVFSEKAIADSSAGARAAVNMSGQVWVDDLRALDVDRSKGVANRLTVYTKVADLFNFTTNWDRTDENFQRLGQTRGNDVRSDRISLNGQFQPHRFLASTGLSFPLSFGYTRFSSTPRLRTGTDLFLRGEDAFNERSTTVDRNFSVSLLKSGDRNPILRNTIGRLNLNFSFSDRVGRSPTNIDSARTLSGGGSYSLAPAEWFKVPIPIWKLRGGGVQKLKLLPETATISFGQTTTRSFSYKRGLGDEIGAYSLQSDIYRKQSIYQLGASWRPLPFGSYAVSATRNAYIPGVQPLYVLGINFGRMTNFTQRLDGRFTLPVHSFFRPSFDFSTNYNEARTPDLSPSLSLGTFSNATNAGVRWEIPFTRLATTTPKRPAAPAAPPVPARSALADSAGADTSFVAAAAPPATAPPPPPGRGFSLPIGRALARLGNVNMAVTFSRTTAFSRYFGVPSVPYRLGLVRDPDTQWSGIELPSISPGSQATDNAQRTYSGDASTTVGLFGRATARVRINYSNLHRVYNNQASSSENRSFPDVQLDWGQVTNLMRLGGVFTGVNATSRVNFVRTLEGISLKSPTSRVKTQNFSPLLQLSGQTKGSANVQLSIDRRSSTREDFTTRRAVRREGEMTVRSSLSRSYLAGQKLPLIGGKGLKSTLTLSLDGTFNKRTGATESLNLPPSRTRTDRLDFNGSGTYSFSNYVNGTIGLGFSQSRDLIYRTQEGDPRTTRSLRLEAAANVRF